MRTRAAGKSQVKSVYLSKLGVRMEVPSAERLKQQTQGGRWFSGAGIGQEFGFRCVVDAGTALYRLVHHVGIPNGPHFHCWNSAFLKQRDKSTWEFIFLVNRQHFFAVYDYKGEVSVGYRLIAPRGACHVSRADFEADTETCARFCRYVEALVNFPPDIVKTQWR